MAEGDTTQDVPDPSKATLLDAFLKLAVPEGPPPALGPWRILQVLGEGGMGVVYLAEQTEPVRRRVALKLIKLGMDTREVLARFESERQALAMMSHPNIARVFDAGATPDGRPFFVMEYVPGLPITQFCDHHAFPLKDRIEVFIQVCQGVQHAHQKGIIHRDIKPSNVLVSYEQEKPLAKIIDFGVAKSTNHRLTERTVFTEHGQVIGTPEYMSPEQAEMSSLDIDTRTDIYSLGMLFYELATGTLPFDSKELRKAIHSDLHRRIREADLIPPSRRLSSLAAGSQDIVKKRRTELKHLVRELRGDLDWITMKSVEKDRRLRYASASEFAADLRRYLDHEPVTAGPPGVVYKLRKMARKHRRAIAGAAILLFAMVFGFAALRQVDAAREYNEALQHRDRLHALELDQTKLLEDLRTARGGLESWQPVWERTSELRAWNDLEAIRRCRDHEFENAVLALQKGLDAALPWLPLEHKIRTSLEELYFERYKEAIQKGGLHLAPEHFKDRLEGLGLETHAKVFEEGSVEFSTEPPGGEIYCFRYEKTEERLVPVPFPATAGPESSSGGLRGPEGLRVQESRAMAGPDSAFKPGDRLVEVRGRSVSSLGDLARALEGVGEGETIIARLVRGGTPVSLEWKPFPADTKDSPYRAGRLIDPREQLGLTFDLYPLEALEACRLGKTGPGQTVGATLPRGSYLFLVKKEGFPDVRVPVVVPFDERRKETIPLVPTEEIPEGFIYIAAGPACLGGDPEADQALPRSTERVPGFFIGRREVTVGEYLGFVNDPEVAARIDRDTGAIPATQGGKRIVVVPREPRGLLFQLEGGAWKSDALRAEQPVVGVSEAAAREYASWLTKKRGGRWRFRLPSDAEWEKAARGVDRRHYVWGDVLIRSFTNALGGSPRGRTLNDTASHPIDESIYGVRDMAGSALEPTSDKTAPGFVSCRGGSWREMTDYYFRIANRLGRWEGRDDPGIDMGIRLAADLPGR